MDKSFKIRIISGVALLALVLAFYFIGGVFLDLFLLLGALVCVYELRTTFGLTEIVGLVISGLFVVAVFRAPLLLFAPLIFTYVLVEIFLQAFTKEQGSIQEIQLSLFTFIYGVIPLLLLHLITKLVFYNEVFLWIILIAAATDTFAYISGTYLGKRQLMPKLSPKKTVEGALGGILGALVVCIIFRFITMDYIAWIHVIWMSLVGAILAEFGDIVGSFIKRQCGVKDFGRLIPGHGGLMDRLDSISVVATFIVIAFTLLKG